jgi:hypothetical protein
LYGNAAVKINQEPEVIVVKDQDSIDTYGLFDKEVTSEFIRGLEFADGLGRAMILNSSDKTAGLKLDVKTDWTLEIDQVVTIDSDRFGINGQFKITGITERLGDGSLAQTITVYPYVPTKWAVWDNFNWDDGSLWC